MKKLYLVLCTVIDVLVFGACLLAFVYFNDSGSSFDASVSMGVALTALAFAAISAVSLSKVIHNREDGKTIFNSLLMKLACFFLCSSTVFLGMDDGIYAFAVFMLIGIIIAAATIGLNVSAKKNSTPVRKPVADTYEYKYKGKWAWEEAAAEYARLNGIADLQNLTEEENDRIYDYTVTPLSYMFYWLAESGFLNDDFHEEFPGLAERMLSREDTPVQALTDLDYYFGSEWFKKEIIPFFRNYVDTEGRFNGKADYLYDYYDAIGNPDDRYYCVDFSWDILDRLTAVISKRYEASNSRSSLEYYEDDEPFARVHSERLNADLKAYRTGIVSHGFSEGEEAYLTRCMENLESLSDQELNRFGRLVGGTYDDYSENEMYLREFKPYSIHVFEPKNEGDVAYAVSGEADYEPEHGISFTVRNGTIVDWGYSYDFEDVYNPELEERYRYMMSIDFTGIKTEEDAKKYLDSGELVRVKLLPDMPYCTSLSDEEYIYLTPHALEKKEYFEKCIRNIRAYYYNHFNVYVEYETSYIKDSNGELLSVVPKNIYITEKDKDKWFKIRYRVDVWY